MTATPQSTRRNSSRLHNHAPDRAAGRDGSGRAGTSLSRGALRLLTALKEDGAEAVADPTREDGLIVRGTRAGVSVGRGAFPVEAAHELVSADLAEPKNARRLAFAISAAGLAHLRRAASRAPDEAFGYQHRELAPGEVDLDGVATRVSRNAAESPLDWLRRRKDRDGEALIDPACYEAGERLRRDLTFGGMLPSVTARWEASLGASKGGLRDPAAATDAALAARQRVRNALGEVGSDFAGVLVDLCGFLKGLEAMEREHGWPPRSGKVVVRLALRRLAEHYGLEVEARGPERSRGVRTWRTVEDETPGVDEPDGSAS